MKKLLIFFFAYLLLGLSLLDAQLVNPGFETWSHDYLVPAAMNPNSGAGTSGWWDFNFLGSSALGGSPVTVFKDSANPTPYLGSYCAKIVSQAMTKKSFDTVKYFGIDVPDTNGLIFSGYCDTRSNLTIKTGIPCNNAYRSLTFYFRYVPNGTDTCSCTVKMFHYNSVTHKRDQIGFGYWSWGHSVTLWSPETLNITYDSIHVIPDTALIIFSAASLYANPKIGDTLNIDTGSVVLGMNTVISENNQVKLYPNPASNQITLTTWVNAANVFVYDLSGRLTGTYVFQGKTLTINTQSYSAGTYFYELQDINGARLNEGKFCVLNR